MTASTRKLSVIPASVAPDDYAVAVKRLAGIPGVVVVKLKRSSVNETLHESRKSVKRVTFLKALAVHCWHASNRSALT